MSDAAADEVRLHLPSHPKYLPLVRAVAEHGACTAGFSEETRQQIVLAVTEGVTNVMRHGYRGRTDQPIDLSLHAPEGLFHLEIRDRAPFVDPTAIASRPLDQVRPGGLGVHLMRATMDRVEYRRNDHGGTTLVLVKRIPSPEEAS